MTKLNHLFTFLLEAYLTEMNAFGQKIMDLLNTERTIESLIALLKENPIWVLFSYKNEYDGTFQIPLEIWTEHTGIVDLPGEVIGTTGFPELKDGHIIVLETATGRMLTIQYDN
jgi:hypothetical protein